MSQSQLLFQSVAKGDLIRLKDLISEIKYNNNHLVQTPGCSTQESTALNSIPVAQTLSPAFASGNSQYSGVPPIIASTIKKKNTQHKRSFNRNDFNNHQLNISNVMRADDIFNNQGDTLLHTAVWSVQPQMIDYLLSEQQINPNIPNRQGDMALHIAAGSGQYETLQLLLKYRAQVDNKNEHDGCTALHRASQHGSFECCKILLKHRADINLQDNKGETCLFKAITHN